MLLGGTRVKITGKKGNMSSSARRVLLISNTHVTHFDLMPCMVLHAPKRWGCQTRNRSGM